MLNLWFIDHRIVFNFLVWSDGLSSSGDC